MAVRPLLELMDKGTYHSGSFHDRHEEEGGLAGRTWKLIRASSELHDRVNSSNPLRL